MAFFVPPIPRGASGATLHELFTFCILLADRVNGLLNGKSNSRIDVTLTANVASTTVTDARIGVNTQLIWTPTSANASVEIGAGTIYQSTTGTGSAIIVHANNAQADRTFRMSMVG